MRISKKLLAGALGLSILTGGAGVYAGTVIEQYKTPRGNIATVEPEHIHKNRIGITVNGKELNSDTWYANRVTYAPLREVAEMLGASVEYDSKTMSANIVTESELLNLLGLKIGVPYYVKVGRVDQYVFTITQFNPTTNEFKGTFKEPVAMGSPIIHDMDGKISANTMRFKYPKEAFELEYHGGTQEFKGKGNRSGQNITMFID